MLKQHDREQGASWIGKKIFEATVQAVACGITDLLATWLANRR
jgi:hypothetical protein